MPDEIGLGSKPPSDVIQRRVFENSRIQVGPGGVISISESLRALPTLPAVLFRFLGLIADPQTPLQQLADFICSDPALLARILAGLNSAGDQKAGVGNSTRQAIALLGRERIRNLAYTTPLLRSFEPLRVGLHSATYWERSLVCAHACETLARHLQHPSPEQAYIAGLMHDLGHLLILHKNPDAMRLVYEKWAVRPGDLLEVESEVLGIDHCQLGMEVARRLNFEPWLREAVGYHHHPSPHLDLTSRITCIGSAFCHYKGIDFFPSRKLAQGSRQREMEQIIQELLPPLSEKTPSELLAAMERATEPLRNSIVEMFVDLYPAAAHKANEAMLSSEGGTLLS